MITDHKILSSLQVLIRKQYKKFYLPRWIIFIGDNVLVFSTFIISYLLRFNFELNIIDFEAALKHSALVVSVFMVFSLITRSYAGLIRHTTVQDVFKVVKNSTLCALTLLAITIIQRMLSIEGSFNIPISILLIYYVAVTTAMVIVRILIKQFYEIVSSIPAGRKRVLVYGAGVMGVIVKNVIARDHSGEFSIVGFVDRNPRLKKKEIEGIPIYQPANISKTFVAKNRIESMIFAIRDIDIEEKKEIFKNGLNVGLEVMEVPRVDKWLNGQFEVQHLKKIDLEDLLEREPIKLNMDRISDGLKDKTIMVTGAAGSIGSELIRQLCKFHTRRIIMVDNAETPMFMLEKEIRESCFDNLLEFCIADVTDSVGMDLLFRKYKPEIIFHAAAYKHVPLMEENPKEAIRVNVGGTLLVSHLSEKYGAERFVLVSTDKAVNPTNVMGASKRICELILQSRNSKSESKVQYVVTRFGNVLGSNGSVIPLFEKQIKAGGPVTVTHKDITRFFMTIPEACQLVLEAGFMGNSGQIYVFDMGEPVRIDDLAMQMIRLSGYTPGNEIKIEYTGLRPGEKLYEELFFEMEETIPTHNPKIRLAKLGDTDYHTLMVLIHEIFHTYHTLDDKALIGKMRLIVPEFSPSNENFTDQGKPESLEEKVLEA